MLPVLDGDEIELKTLLTICSYDKDKIGDISTSTTPSNIDSGIYVNPDAAQNLGEEKI